LWNSGPENPQSYWERGRRDCVRVVQRDWERPACEEWVATLESAVRAADPPLVLSAHSLGCALVAHWAGTAGSSVGRVRGALLVAPSDVDDPAYPEGPTGFTPMPRRRLPFRTLVVASSNDVYVSMQRAREYAEAWGAELVDAGPIGHINADSKLGDWLFGRRLLEGLL
jgi:serine hydrolase